MSEELFKPVEEYLTALRELTKAKNEVARLEKLSKYYSEKVIPETFEKFDMKSISVKGLQISVEDYVHGSILKDYKETGLQWMRDQGYEKLIKNQVKLIYNAADKKEFEAVCDLLYKQGDYLEIKTEEGVHHSTLSDFIRKGVEKGLSFPASFSIHRGLKTVVKEIKK